MNNGKWKKDLIGLAKRVIGINSTNNNGNRELAEFIGCELKGRGFSVAYQKATLYGAPQANVIGRFGPAKGESLLLNTHLDTVSTQPEEWTKTGGDPLRAVIRDGKLYGLGSADTKLAMVCQIIAIDLLKDRTWKKPVVITGTYGEEVGLIGVQKLIRHRWLQPAYVLNSEPTNFVPCDGHKGFRVYEIKGRDPVTVESEGYMHIIKFKGKAAHSAVPEKGINAIVRALQWAASQGADVKLVEAKGGLAPNIIAPSCILKVHSPRASLRGFAAYGGKLIFKRKNVDALPAVRDPLVVKALLSHLRKKGVKGQSNNWGKVNLSQGSWEIIFDHRYAPGTDPDPTCTRLQKTVGEHRGWNFRMIKNNLAHHQKTSPRFQKFLKTGLASVDRKMSLTVKPGCTEAGFLSRLGCDVITIGPGFTYGNAHEPNEHVRVKDLEKAVLFYKKMIEQICM